MHYQTSTRGDGSRVTKVYGVHTGHHYQMQTKHASSYWDVVVWSLALEIASVAKLASDAPACASAKRGALITQMTYDIIFCVQYTTDYM